MLGMKEWIDGKMKMVSERARISWRWTFVSNLEMFTAYGCVEYVELRSFLKM